MVIIADLDKCTQCHTCQMVCSLVYQGACNPEKASIVISPDKISFTEECIGGCSLCTQYCPKEAITVKGG